MNIYLDRIFGAATINEACAELQKALDSLKATKYLANLSDYYEDMAARSPSEVQDWFDQMRDDDQAKEEGNLKEVFGLFDAALRRLRELAFHRTE